jgi:hypothetical protein
MPGILAGRRIKMSEHRTPQQMLQEIVQAGIDGGYLKKQKVSFLEIETDSRENFQIVFIEDVIGWFKLTLADLINDNEFMKDVYDEGKVVVECPLRKSCRIKKNWGCQFKNMSCADNAYKIKRYQHIQQQAIIIDNPQDQVRFLYESMGGRG